MASITPPSETSEALPPELSPPRDVLLLILSFGFCLFTVLPVFRPIQPWQISLFVLLCLLVVGVRGLARAAAPLRAPAEVPWGSAFFLPLLILILGGLMAAGDWSPSPQPMPALALSLWLVLLVAVAEELVIRLALFRVLARHTGWIAAAVLSSLAFGLLHVPMTSLLGAIPLFLGGLVYCWSYKRSRTIFFPIVLHCGNNVFWLFW